MSVFQHTGNLWHRGKGNKSGAPRVGLQGSWGTIAIAQFLRWTHVASPLSGLILIFMVIEVDHGLQKRDVERHQPHQHNNDLSAHVPTKERLKVDDLQLIQKHGQRERKRCQERMPSKPHTSPDVTHAHCWFFLVGVIGARGFAAVGAADLFSGARGG
jgi:hypothetical protein